MSIKPIKGKLHNLPLPFMLGKKNPRDGRNSGKYWDGSYGSGAGKANWCVAFTACPVCESEKGYLCKGPTGPIFDTHYKRRYILRDAIKAFRLRSKA